MIITVVMVFIMIFILLLWFFCPRPRSSGGPFGVGSGYKIYSPYEKTQIFLRNRRTDNLQRLKKAGKITREEWFNSSTWFKFKLTIYSQEKINTNRSPHEK